MEATKAFRDVFRSLAAAYDRWFTTPLGQYVAMQEQQLLRSALAEHPPAKALEVGAGTGFATQVLVAMGWDVVAVEPSAAMRKVGEQKLPAVQWVDAFAEALPFPAQSFELLLFFTTLEFVNDPRRALQEAWRVLKPAGALLIGFLEAESPWVALYRHRADLGELPWTAARFYDRQQLEEFVGKPAHAVASALWLAPYAQPPFAEAEQAGKRAGNVPGFSLIKWRK